jgi:site-specific recombinase XerD
MTHRILAVLRTDKVNKDQVCPINVFIYTGGKITKKISIGYGVPITAWNTETRRVDKKFKNATLINSLIDKTITEIDTKILEEKIVNGSADVVGIFRREVVKNIDFYTFAEDQIKKKKYADETRRNYTVFLDKMKAYKKSLRLSEVDYQFLISYESHLRDTLKNSVNTVWGNMKFINTIINDALKSKYITEDPFKIYSRPKYKQTTRSFLVAEEIEKIDSFYRTTEDFGIKTVAGYFLFMIYTGLRYSDATRFTKNDHVINNERIVIETQKTGKITNLYINDKIRSVMNFIDENRLRITQVDFNRKLKIIAAVCGIKKKVSSHVGRHSFGSSLAAMGVPERVAQGLLAHGSAASTKVYYHLQNQSLDEAMKKFNQQ